MVRAIRARADREPRCADSGLQSDRRWERTPLTRFPERVARARRRPQGGRMTVLDAFDRAVFCDDAELAERLDRPHAAVRAAVEAPASRARSTARPTTPSLSS